MTDTPTPAKSFMDELTEHQRHVFGLIAINQDAGHDPRTLRALAARGLIVEHRVEVPDRWAPTVSRWEVPVPVHIEWARWCAEQPDEEES